MVNNEYRKLRMDTDGGYRPHLTNRAKNMIIAVSEPQLSTGSPSDVPASTYILNIG